MIPLQLAILLLVDTVKSVVDHVGPTHALSQALNTELMFCWQHCVVHVLGLCKSHPNSSGAFGA